METVGLFLVIIACAAFVAWKFLFNKNKSRLPRRELHIDDDVHLHQQEMQRAMQVLNTPASNKQPTIPKSTNETSIKKPLNQEPAMQVDLDRKPKNIRPQQQPVKKSHNKPAPNKIVKENVKPNQQELDLEIDSAASPASVKEKIIVLYVKAPEGKPFRGGHLLPILTGQGFVHGKMKVFHFLAAAQQPVFSLASAVEPGVFDLNKMPDETYKGLSLFMRLPGPMSPTDALDKMLFSAHNLATALEGELLDETHSSLTQQRIKHMRSEIIEFQRISQIAAARMHA